jgi:alpha-amylase/alpha-mannosidase (GH57 family)
MPALRVVLLWHMHQPFYKDLVTGEYRLPWVRMHGLKDYYGMVRLAREFPRVHQTFNLVPSLITQLQEYVAGDARDPFLDLASRPAADLSSEERRAALQYLFQANAVHLIGRYPRYRELWELFHGAGEHPERAERYFRLQDFTDLQVLSQLAWFDEYFQAEPEIAALVAKGRGFSAEERDFVIAQQRRILAAVLPEYANAARAGAIEISASPFYHPILPLLCDTDAGAASTPGLPLPQRRFRRPDDAREQLQRGLDLHQQLFGARPRGVWPSEGSVSDEALAIAHSLGVEWMATDEGVLGRSLGLSFARDGGEALPPGASEKLYTIYTWEKDGARMRLFFRDHALSDLVGFVYSGMPPAQAASHLLDSIKHNAAHVLAAGRDAVVSIILDGENAWEYYPQSGREFLRRFYSALDADPDIEAVTCSEAVARHPSMPQLAALVPGSWINANFNVWIGAPEDNLSWDYLSAARDFFDAAQDRVAPAARQLAREELLIAEGSDWNWWYGPEHHSANDREFDELYRKHLSNVYQLLDSTPPEYLAQPIARGAVRPTFVPQTAYIHPRIEGDLLRYFAWLGAAMYTADRRAGAMHGKQFLLDSIYAGIDEDNLYGRLDFVGAPPQDAFSLLAHIQAWEPQQHEPRRGLRLEAHAAEGVIRSWNLRSEAGGPLTDSEQNPRGIKLVLLKNFEFRLPLSFLLSPEALQMGEPAGRVRLRISLWRERLPVDALPLEGWIELRLLSEPELAAFEYGR